MKEPSCLPTGIHLPTDRSEKPVLDGVAAERAPSGEEGPAREPLGARSCKNQPQLSRVLSLSNVMAPLARALKDTCGPPARS